MDPMGLATVGLNIVGGLFSTFQAGKQAKINGRLAIEEYEGAFVQVGIQNEQLVDEVKAIEMATDLAVTQRVEQAIRVKNRNTAFVAASGTSFNASQSVAAKETDKNVRKDVQTMEFNRSLQKKRIVDQIKVNRMSLDTAKSRAAATISQGTQNTIGTAVSAGIKLGESLIKSGVGGDIGTAISGMMKG